MAERGEPGAPERVDRDQSGGWRGAVSEMRRDMSVEKMDERLREVASDKPLVRHLLDTRTLVKAIAVAAALTLLTMLLFSVQLAGLVLLVSFFAAWLLLASRSYEKRRGTQDVRREGADTA